jgi:hypothetical protein
MGQGSIVRPSALTCRSPRCLSDATLEEKDDGQRSESWSTARRRPAPRSTVLTPAAEYRRCHAPYPAARRSAPRWPSARGAAFLPLVLTRGEGKLCCQEDNHNRRPASAGGTFAASPSPSRALGSRRRRVHSASALGGMARRRALRPGHSRPRPRLRRHGTHARAARPHLPS